MSWSDRTLAVESLAMLAAARVLVKATPQRRLVSRIGGAHITGGAAPSPADEVFYLIVHAAGNAFHRLRWLHDALAATKTLSAADQAGGRALAIKMGLIGYLVDADMGPGFGPHRRRATSGL